MSEKRLQGLFIYPDTMENQRLHGAGVYKKISMQLKELRRHYDVELIEAYYKTTTLRKLLSRLPFFPNMFWYRADMVPEDTSFIYFRHEFGDHQINRFFKKLKKRNPRCKIIVELPCYPMDLKTLIRKPSMIPFKYKHIFSMKTLPKYIDRFVVFGDILSIQGTKTIQTANGLDFESESMRKIQPYNGIIHVISVSHMMHWHRIDRFIDGMAQYAASGEKPSIFLHLVGEGPEKAALEDQVKRLNMQDVVRFYGLLTGDALNQVYDQCDVGIEVLNNEDMLSSSLKSREYWAKGLPMITSSRFMPEVSEISEYIHTIPANDDCVDMSAVVSFYTKLYGDNKLEQRKAVAEKIREFAYNHYDTSVIMRPIEDYINEGH